MDESAQEVLFQRIRLHFDKATAIVMESQDRRRYRMNEQDLMNLRNLICLWKQVRDFLKTRVPNFEDLDGSGHRNQDRQHYGPGTTGGS